MWPCSPGCRVCGQDELVLPAAMVLDLAEGRKQAWHRHAECRISCWSPTRQRTA
jgi:hypothetical protein